MSTSSKKITRYLTAITGVSGTTITLVPKATCIANCTLVEYEIGHFYWSSIKLTTTYIHTVVLLVDEEHHTTRTTTELVAIPPAKSLHHPMATSSAGTVSA
jgi:hypothetical protein